MGRIVGALGLGGALRVVVELRGIARIVVDIHIDVQRLGRSTRLGDARLLGAALGVDLAEARLLAADRRRQVPRGQRILCALRLLLARALLLPHQFVGWVGAAELDGDLRHLGLGRRTRAGHKLGVVALRLDLPRLFGGVLGEPRVDVHGRQRDTFKAAQRLLHTVQLLVESGQGIFGLAHVVCILVVD